MLIAFAAEYTGYDCTLIFSFDAPCGLRMPRVSHEHNRYFHIPNLKFIEGLGRAIEPVSLVDLLRALVDDDVLAAAIERVQKCLEVVLARRLTEVGVTNGSGSQSYVDGAIFLGRHGTHHLENRVLLGLWLLRFLDLLRLLLGDFLRLLFFGFALRVLLLILIFLKLPLIMLLFGHLRQLLRFFLLKRLRFDLIKQWHLRLHSVAVRDVLLCGM